MYNSVAFQSAKNRVRGTMEIQMRRIFALASILTITAASLAGQQNRPAITGISHMCVYSSDSSATERFYIHNIGATKGADPQDPAGTRYYFSAKQFVEVLPLPAEHTISRMACVAYNTADAEGLRKYLSARGVNSIGELRTGSDGTSWFKTKDPEGNEVQFIQPGTPPAIPADARPIGTRIIHVGYPVHNKDAENHFYKDILGFQPYWHGSKKPGRLDWYQLQTPEGHDWIEYMMVGDGSTVPLSSIDKNELDVLNHFSIGVPNIEKAVTVLLGEERLSPRHDGPQMGLDGKWQANLYDPDGTRIELMEFQPVIKPCCSAFTADSPVN
jgi:catechol 2,3-dioxygenase-like lactoylglutathione lyase family enzyme